MTGVALWGVHVGPSTPAPVAIAIIAVAAWASVWAVGVSPRARGGLSPVAKQWCQAAMFALAGPLPWCVRTVARLALFTLVAVVNRTLIAAWDQEAAQEETLHRR